MSLKPLPQMASANCAGAVAPEEVAGAVTFVEGDGVNTVLTDLLVVAPGGRALNTDVQVANPSCYDATIEVDYLDGIDCVPCGSNDATIVTVTHAVPAGMEWCAPAPSTVAAIRVALTADIPVVAADDATQGLEMVTITGSGVSTAECPACIQRVPA